MDETEGELDLSCIYLVKRISRGHIPELFQEKLFSSGPDLIVDSIFPNLTADENYVGGGGVFCEKYIPGKKPSAYVKYVIEETSLEDYDDLEGSYNFIVNQLLTRGKRTVYLVGNYEYLDEDIDLIAKQEAEKSTWMVDVCRQLSEKGIKAEFVCREYSKVGVYTILDEQEKNMKNEGKKTYDQQKVKDAIFKIVEKDIEYK